MKDTATRALNKMISSMRNDAENPENVAAVRRPNDSQALLKTAAQDEAVLNAKNLTVPESPYD
jgi:hypothetical protein